MIVWRKVPLINFREMRGTGGEDPYNELGRFS